MPDPFRTREDLLKKKKKKKKKEGAACHLRMFTQTHKKNLRYTSDSVTSDRLDLDDASLGQDLDHRTRRTTLNSLVMNRNH